MSSTAAVTLRLSKSLQQSLPSLYEAPLQAVQFGAAAVFGAGAAAATDSATVVRTLVLGDTSTTLQQAARMHVDDEEHRSNNKNYNKNSPVSLCFVVRRPG